MVFILIPSFPISKDSDRAAAPALNPEVKDILDSDEALRINKLIGLYG